LTEIPVEKGGVRSNIRRERTINKMGGQILHLGKKGRGLAYRGGGEEAIRKKVSNKGRSISQKGSELTSTVKACVVTQAGKGRGGGRTRNLVGNVTIENETRF